MSLLKKHDVRQMFHYRYESDDLPSKMLTLSLLH
jgi:hypothetical protein